VDAALVARIQKCLDTTQHNVGVTDNNEDEQTLKQGTFLMPPLLNPAATPKGSHHKQFLMTA